VGYATWARYLARDLEGTWQLGVATIGVLLIAIGALLSATNSGSSSSEVLTAIGTGVIGLVFLAMAARRAVAEQEAGTTTRSVVAPLLFAVFAGLVLVAVGSGLPTGVDNQGASVAAAILEAVGFGVIAGTIVVARGHRLIGSRSVVIALDGVAALVVAYIELAFVSGIVLGPDVTLTGIRTGFSIGFALEALAAALLGLAAWARTMELSTSAAGSGALPMPPPVPPPPPSVAAGPGAACPSCGTAVGADETACPQCGAPLSAGAAPDA
jgi:hypothetical protein